MKGKRRSFSASFEAKVALSAMSKINMTSGQQKIKSLLESFLKKREGSLKIATDQEVENFKKEAKTRNISDSVIDQLVEFYEISNGIPCIDSFDFYSCNDERLYEWGY